MRRAARLRAGSGSNYRLGATPTARPGKPLMRRQTAASAPQIPMSMCCLFSSSDFAIGRPAARAWRRRAAAVSASCATPRRQNARCRTRRCARLRDLPRKDNADYGVRPDGVRGLWTRGARGRNGRVRTTAIRKIREARMDANSAITHGGKY
jgi:hypothetical protein